MANRGGGFSWLSLILRLFGLSTERAPSGGSSALTSALPGGPGVIEGPPTANDMPVSPPPEQIPWSVLVQAPPEQANKTVEVWQPGSAMLPVPANSPLFYSVFRIKTYYTTSDLERPLWGTAFYVGGNIFMTCAHNFVRDRTRPATMWKESSVQFGSEWYNVAEAWILPAFLQRHENAQDVALFRLSERLPASARALPMVKTSDAPQGFATAVGFPTNMPGSDGSIMYAAKGGYRATTQGSLVYHACSTLEGNSGGPVLTDAGIVAVHTGSDHGYNRGVSLNDQLINAARNLAH